MISTLVKREVLQLRGLVLREVIFWFFHRVAARGLLSSIGGYLPQVLLILITWVQVTVSDLAMLCIHVLPLLTAFVFLYGGIQHSKLAQDLRNVELLPDVVDSFGFLSLESRQFTAGAISCSSNCLLSSEKICIQRQEDAFAWVPLNIIFRFFIVL